MFEVYRNSYTLLSLYSISDDTSDDGSNAAHPSASDGGSIHAHPSASDGGGNDAHPSASDGGRINAHPSTSHGGSIHAHPSTSHGSSIHAHPSASDGGGNDVHPSASDGGGNDAHPSTSHGGSIHVHPSTSDGHSIQAYPSADCGGSIDADLLCAFLIPDSFLYSSDSEDEKVLLAVEDPQVLQTKTSMSLQEILEQLASKINSDKISKFNISRSNLWKGALRGLRSKLFLQITRSQLSLLMILELLRVQ